MTQFSMTSIQRKIYIIYGSIEICSDCNSAIDLTKVGEGSYLRVKSRNVHYTELMLLLCSATDILTNELPTIERNPSCSKRAVIEKALLEPKKPRQGSPEIPAPLQQQH